MEFRQCIVKIQNPQCVKLYVGEDITCGISNAVIQHITNEFDFITGPDYVWLMFGIFDKRYADEIWQIIDCNFEATFATVQAEVTFDDSNTDLSDDSE